jgi:hypothetical protein
VSGFWYPSSLIHLLVRLTFSPLAALQPTLNTR